MLTGSGITYAHGDRMILRDAALSVVPGGVTGLGGPSGCGKTTLAQILAGRLMPRTGTVHLDGAPLPAARRGTPAPVQYAAQVAELAVDPRWRIGAILANAGPVDAGVCTALGVKPSWHDRYPAEVSGGELARVALARLFHPGLRHLICDEVTAQLDALEQVRLLDSLLALTRRRGIGVILISHSAGLRHRYCDDCVTLPHG